jgi:iron complex transport system ATP-binding protein
VDLELCFPGVTVSVDAEALVVCSLRPLQALSSAVIGGGLLDVRYILNRHVPKGYDHPQPDVDLLTFAQASGIHEPFVGLMTAAFMHQARTNTVQTDGLTVSAVVTAGLSNASVPGLSPPAVFTPGTINIILLIDAQLTPAALVNAVITATEVKTQTILAQGTYTPEGHLATGTSTDAIVVACTGRGQPLPYAGPATLVGWLIGRSVRAALQQALQKSPGRANGTDGAALLPAPSS